MTMTGPLDAQQARAILQHADELAASGDYQAASQFYARVIGNGDAEVHTAALLGLADSRYRLNDEEGALQQWIVATQAPENALSWRAWVNLAGARVRQGDNNGAIRAYREAERRAPPEERPAIASRLGWLNKESGNSWQAQRYFGRSRTGVFTPLATYAIIALTSAISLFVLVSAPDLGNALALDKVAVLQGEWWRLLTATVVHGSIIHLGFNMYALYIVGPIVEALYGRPLYVTFYILCGLAGSLASFLFLANPSVGASGAIFGMFGLLAVSTYIHKPALGRQARSLTGQIVMLIVINLVIGFGVGGVFGAQIDNAAHIGGLIAGAWLGLTVVPRGMSTLTSFWSTPESAEPVVRSPAARPDPDRRDRCRAGRRHRRPEHHAVLGGEPALKTVAATQPMDRSLPAVLFGTFTLRFSTGLTGGLLAFYLGNLPNHGGPEVTAVTFAVLYAAFYGTELVLSPVFGLLSDRLGHHRVMQWGPIFGGVAVVITGLTTNLALLGGTRVLEGAATAASVPSILGFIAMATMNDEGLRGRTSARFELATIAGIGGGTFAATLLYPVMGSLAFFLNAAIYAGSFLIYRYGVAAPDKPAGPHAAPEYGWRRYARLLRTSHVWLLAPTWIAINAALGVYAGQGLFNLVRTPNPDFADQLLAGGLEGWQISIGLVAAGIVFFAGLIYWGNRFKTTRRTTIIFYGILGGALLVVGGVVFNHSGGLDQPFRIPFVLLAGVGLFVLGRRHARRAWLAGRHVGGLPRRPRRGDGSVQRVPRPRPDPGFVRRRHRCRARGDRRPARGHAGDDGHCPAAALPPTTLRAPFLARAGHRLTHP